MCAPSPAGCTAWSRERWCRPQASSRETAGGRNHTSTRTKRWPTSSPGQRGCRRGHGLRGPTYTALFGLLAVTGLRVGGAVALDNVDVDTDEAALHVRHAKNNRNRMVPITSCTAERLAWYRSLRDRTLRAPDTPAFLPGRAWATDHEGFGGAQLRARRPGDRPAGAPALGSSRHGSPPVRPEDTP